ncbi:U3 small nucleolar ribonucleoprotein [Tieghemostelium lacteum]|uniref:U3 small nucleolar ribonucleoprotein n=1 Tax=Tieghemostelium lacteum TaxID=361077 RepID=A0A152AAC4_TIELA|nr:U3 small nucleolar ribonucleoprotein [Tieghemostelium lacteum]|eukprot:KYR03170.1 U3 small nucleolar ribonucleoprotein [Tieghemostelium lacteum]
MRDLKYHEKKLLKKVNFVHYKKENPTDLLIISRYGLSGKEEFSEYLKICAQLKKLLTAISELDDKDPVKHKLSGELAEKFYNMGIIDTPTPSELTKIGVSAFCRRRISTMLVRMKFAQNLPHAVSLLRHGHIRIGPEIVKDPALIVTRKFQDFMTWVDTSVMRKKVMEYKGELDDYDLMQ